MHTSQCDGIENRSEVNDLERLKRQLENLGHSDLIEYIEQLEQQIRSEYANRLYR